MKRILPVICLSLLLTAGCKDQPPATSQEPAGDNIITIEDAADTEDNSAVEEKNTDTDETPNQAEETGDAADNKPEIIWIGDSLTQGSFGDDNHNENNPQAPWRVLGEISGRNVAGVGFWGYVTHDIFWAYGEYNGIKDPDIIYVYWVGSNDFYQSVDNVSTVIEETDHFNESVGITKYLFLGTTNRGDMDPDAYIGINKALEEKYGDKYLDIMPYVEFGTDGVHLTEESYAKIANAVNDKLNELYY